MIRTGFVSNSSSSSFVIRKDDLSRRQIAFIKNHIQYVYDGQLWMHNLHGNNPEDAWIIEEDENHIKGSTYMDNFNMHEFLEWISVYPDEVTWLHS